MEKIDISTKVKEIISQELNVNLDLVTNEKDFVEDFDADSLDTIELIMKLEDEFNIEISEEDAQKITTVQSAIIYILEKMK